MLRSSLAVLAGFITVFLLVGLADFLYLHVDPTAFTKAGAPIGLTVVAITITYLEIINVIGGYVTARIASNASLKTAFVLGLLGFAITATMAVVQWKTVPHSFAIATTLMVLPACVFGGRLAVKR